jgi:hypothetical protein
MEQASCQFMVNELKGGINAENIRKIVDQWGSWNFRDFFVVIKDDEIYPRLEVWSGHIKGLWAWKVERLNDFEVNKLVRHYVATAKIAECGAGSMVLQSRLPNEW